MMEKENVREPGHVRTNPSMFNPSWYCLKQLSKTMEHVIDKHVANKNFEKLVDYGCGNTPYKPFFEPHVKEYIGADIGKNANASIQLTPEGNFPLADNQIDVVLSTQVLEHVDNPDLYLSEACRVLTDNGLIIVTTHGYWMYHPDPQDFWRWTSAGLKKVIEKNGFEVIDFIGIVGRSATGLQLFQAGLMFKLPKFIKLPFFFLMQILIALFDKTTSQETRNKDAAIFIAVAKPKKNLK